MTLPAAERLARFRLSRTANVGPITFRRLLNTFGTAVAAIDRLPELSHRGGKRLVAAPFDAAEAELAAIHAAGAGLIVAGDPEYPPALAAIEDAPPALITLGHPHVLGEPTVAVVGARNASLNGRRFAAELARDLGQAGYTVVSGMARGIDAAAHEGSLATGTAAVMAGGVDVVFPIENTQLYGQITAAGVALSEVPLGTKPLGRHFPRRNRIISGLARGVVVVEAVARSGSLITARLAAEQGREVFAVPGAVRDPRGRGPNQLLRDGATLVESAADVTEVLTTLGHKPLQQAPGRDYQAPPAPVEDEAALQTARPVIVECLSSEPVSIDEIVRQCHMPAAVVHTVLLELELAGRAARTVGNRVCAL